MEPKEPKAHVPLTKSLCHFEIESLLDIGHQELNGDYSKTFILQTADRKHQDLKYISLDMKVTLQMRKFSDIVERFLIVD